MLLSSLDHSTSSSKFHDICKQEVIDHYQICYTVQQTVVGTLKTVISKMKYKPYTKIDIQLFSNEQPFDLAFTCCLEDSHSDHLMKVVKDTSGQHAECLNSLIALNLKNEHFVWFNQVSICLYKSHWSCDVNAMYSIYLQPEQQSCNTSQLGDLSVSISSGMCVVLCCMLVYA